MTTALTVSAKEQLSHLAEEIKSIVFQARERTTIEMIAAKYMIGVAITASQLYKKSGKGQGDLYDEIQELIGVKHTTLADCVKLYEAYPKKHPRRIAEKLYTEHGAWRNVRAGLYGEVSTAVESVEKTECNHGCPKHCKK